MSTFPWTFPQTFSGSPDWQIAGSSIGAPTTELATHRSLILGFRVSTSTLTTVFRPLKPNEGQLTILQTDSGGYRVIDRASGDNTFTLTPPARRDPLRYEGEYHVRRYEESLVSQAVNEWDIEIEFVPTENRSDSPSASASAAADEWGFQTRYGTLATPHVDAEFLGTGRDGVERFELVVRFGFDEAHVFEAALSHLEAARIRQIVDAPNEAVDDTNGDNTLTLTTPSGSTVSDGEYLVTEFESRRLNDEWQEVTTRIAPTDITTIPPPSSTDAYGEGTYNSGTYNQ